LNGKSDFDQLFTRQKLYNLRVRMEKHQDIIFWTKTYLLGLVSEIDEVLREISWKSHRRQEEVEPSKLNVAQELADVTKYCLSLWELWGFEASDVVNYCNEKSELLETVWYEDREVIPPDKILIITDLDGTLADWRLSFRKFLIGSDLVVEDDQEKALEVEMEFGLNYKEYNILRNRFESEGGYSTLVPYRDAIMFLQDSFHNDNAYIVAFTARPFHKHKRIWTDSWKWIANNSVPISQLRSGHESRVLFALQYASSMRVVLLEDNPELILRAANSGIRVIARKHQYNQGISHPLVTLVDSFENIDLKEIINETVEK